MRILALDPGLDGAGAALLDTTLDDGPTTEDPDGLIAAARCIAFTDPIRLPAAKYPEDTERLGHLIRWVESLDGMSPDVAFVEVPQTAGMYKDRRKRSGSRAGVNAYDLWKLNRAIGAILGGLYIAGIPVVEFAPDSMPKTVRHQILTSILNRAGVTRPSNSDVRDACWIGMMALLERQGRTVSVNTLALRGGH